MSMAVDLGYARGSADKLAHRSYDDAAPRNVPARSHKAYASGYRRGFSETTVVAPDDHTGLSLNVQASASTSPSPSAPSAPTQPEGGLEATLPPEAPRMLDVSSTKALLRSRLISTPAASQAASRFGPAPEAPPSAPLTQTMPVAQNALQTATPVDLAQVPPVATAVETFTDKAKAWWSENWQYVALGVGAVVVVGGTVAVVSHMNNKSADPTPRA